jgi:hypothetical protein
MMFRIETMFDSELEAIPLQVEFVTEDYDKTIIQISFADRQRQRHAANSKYC